MNPFLPAVLNSNSRRPSKNSYWQRRYLLPSVCGTENFPPIAGLLPGWDSQVETDKLGQTRREEVFALVEDSFYLGCFKYTRSQRFRRGTDRATKAPSQWAVFLNDGSRSSLVRRDGYQVPDPGAAVAVSLQLILQFAISARDAFMLSQVLGPRTHYKRLNISTGVFQIVENAPPRRTIAAPDTTVATNCLQEFVDILGRYFVFYGDQYGARIVACWKRVTIEVRQGPMVPSRDVHSRVRQSQKESQCGCRTCSGTCPQECGVQPEMCRDRAPGCASGGHRALYHERRDRQDPRAHPVRGVI